MDVDVHPTERAAGGPYGVQHPHGQGLLVAPRHLLREIEVDVERRSVRFEPAVDVGGIDAADGQQLRDPAAHLAAHRFEAQRGSGTATLDDVDIRPDASCDPGPERVQALRPILDDRDLCSDRTAHAILEAGGRGVEAASHDQRHIDVTVDGARRRRRETLAWEPALRVIVAAVHPVTARLQRLHCTGSGPRVTLDNQHIKDLGHAPMIDSIVGARQGRAATILATKVPTLSAGVTTYALAVADVAGPRSLRQLLDAVVTVGSDLDLPSMLERIVQSAVDLVGATYGALGVLDETGTRLAQFITIGIDDKTHRSIGDLPEGHGILGLLIVDAKPLRLPDLSKHPDSFGFPPGHPPMQSFLGVPIRLRNEVFGNLYLTDKRSAAVFTDVDEELAVGLAAAAGVAIENTRLNTKLHELALVEDRERIARDLHDTVIQRLFATGMSLQGSIRLVQSDPAAATARIEGAVDDLDLTVKHIRTAIFGLEQGRVDDDGLRNRVLALMRESAGPLGFEPRVLLDGPLDTGVASGVATEMLATLREALSNVARHAKASRVDVEVVVDVDVCLRVIDDGIGPPDDMTPRGKGLRNMAARAAKLGGALELRGGPGAGTVLEWRAPKE